MAGAVEFTGDTISFEAGVDLSSYQFRFVILTTDSKIDLVGSDGDIVLGILQNKPLSGQTAQVRIAGGSKLYVSDDGSITVGTLIMAEGTDKGDGITATGAGKFARAIALEAGASDTFMSVLLSGPTVMHS